jgi:hypothetical protein
MNIPNIKKLCALLLFITSLGYGEVTNLGEIKEENSFGKIYNRPARISTKNDFFFNVSYLYWQALEKGLDANLFFSGLSSDGIVNFFNDNLEEPINDVSYAYLNNTYAMNFQFSSGFKIGVGYNLFHDDWTVFVEYLSLQVNDQKKISSINDAWNLNLYIFDVNMYRFSYVGQKLSLAPVIAVRLFWLNQKLYKTFLTEQNELKTIDIKSRSKWAVGPKAGINSRWELNQYFQCFCNIAGILAYQRFDIDIEANNLPELINYKTKKRAIVPILEGIIGVSIGGYLGDNTRHIELSCGYEAKLFFQQNHMISQMSSIQKNIDGSIGNLTMHGLTASFRYDF